MNREKSFPFVSLVTVTFNAAQTVASTMRNVAGQTFVDYEHIVMDGASTDATLETVKSLATDRTRVFSSPDKGIYDAMNKALREAKGEYVLFLNAGDCFADADALQRLADAAMADGLPDVVYGDTVLVDCQGNILGPRHLSAPSELTVRSFRKGMVVCHQAFMVKRNVAPEYDTSYRLSSDYDWCIKCLKKSTGNRYVGDKPVIHYLAEGMTTRNHKASLIERYKIMCRHYGMVPTLMRHIGFAFRYALRRFHAPNNQ